MPGPGHPGHFPKPPGWVDRPGADRPPTGGGRPPATGSGTAPGPSGGAAERTPPRPPDPARPRSQASAGSDGSGAAGGGSSRAAEAAARVADMLVDDDAETARRSEERTAAQDAEAAKDADDVEEAEDAVEDDIEELAVSGPKLAAAEAARDEYLDSLRRLQADFENYKKRIQRQQVDLKERAAEDLVVKLLPVLDTCDLAMAHAEQGVEPIHRSLMDVLRTAGLDRIDPANQPFDPNEHDAVLHEQGDDSAAPEVIEVLRAGYRWKGRVLRPAMVKVKG